MPPPAPRRSPSSRRRMLGAIARSQRWVQRQRSQRADTELGTFDFLVLCFEQIAIAGAAMNCFESRDGDTAVFPATVALLPLAICTMVFFSAVVVWLSPWLAGSCKCSCCGPRLCTTTRHAMPIITVILKLLFLNYVVGMLSRSPHFELKSQLADLLGALVLLLCELVDMFALLHTWWIERRTTGGLTIQELGARHEGRMSFRKQLVLTFFDRWKDCGTVTSFTSQSELALLATEVPSMMWAAWTTCSIGNTPDRIPYHLHRLMTMLTIVMGIFVMDPAPELASDIQGASVFLIADIALSSLNVYHGHVKQSRQALAAVQESPESVDDDGDEKSYAVRSDDDETQSQDTTVYSSLPSVRVSSKTSNCLQLKRQRARFASALRSISKRQWVRAGFDTFYPVYVVLNFFQTQPAAQFQQELDAEASAASNSTASSQDVMAKVNLEVIIIDSTLGVVLAVTLIFRWLYSYSSSPWRQAKCGQMPRMGTANIFELSIQTVKLGLVGISIYVFGVVLVQKNELVFKEEINSLIAWIVGMVCIAYTMDAFGRALRGIDGAPLSSSPPTLVQEDGRISTFGKLNTAIQVLWDRLNDFMSPLCLMHVVLYTKDVAANFTVFYLVLAVCIFHAIIAYVDRIDVTGATYAAERFGYLLAVVFVSLQSPRYEARVGTDIVAPTQLVFINFTQQLIMLVSMWRKRRARRLPSSLERVDTLDVPMLSSQLESDASLRLSTSARESDSHSRLSHRDTPPSDPNRRVAFV